MKIKKTLIQVKKSLWPWGFILLLPVVMILAFLNSGKLEKVYKGEVTVEYLGERGFVPSRIVVAKGTTVNFKNISGSDFWPATDFYPEDNIYPQFNSNKRIPSGSSWSFKFNDSGNFGYHDDIRPINKGTIVVTDAQGNIIPIGQNCNNLDALDYTQRQICWYNQIKDAIKRGGVSEALKVFSSLYTKYPLFAQGCHDAMHLVGDEAYREYKKGKKFTFSVETTYCGYGFYHGFIEAMLYTTGDYGEVRNFCESLNSNLGGNIEAPNAIYSCYHGIGHSTFDGHDPALYGDEKKMAIPAIATCEKVTQGLEPEKTKQCVTGVFNALAIAYSNDLYNLKMNPKDPNWFCRTQTGVYKTSCFMEVSMAWISSTMGHYNYKFTDGAKFIQNLNDIDGEKASMSSLAADFVHLHQSDMSNREFINECLLVRNDLQSYCIQGTELALLNWGTPGEEYKRVLSFCSQNEMNQGQKTDCYKYIFRNLPGMYSKDKRLSICNNEVPVELKDSCINYGN